MAMPPQPGGVPPPGHSRKVRPWCTDGHRREPCPSRSAECGGVHAPVPRRDMTHSTSSCTFTMHAKELRRLGQCKHRAASHQGGTIRRHAPAHFVLAAMMKPHPLRRALKQERHDEPFFPTHIPAIRTDSHECACRACIDETVDGPRGLVPVLLAAQWSKYQSEPRTSLEVGKCGRWASLEIVA